MKKFLSILAAVGLTATASTAVVACSSATKADSDGNFTKTVSIKLNKDAIHFDSLTVTPKDGGSVIINKGLQLMDTQDKKAIALGAKPNDSKVLSPTFKVQYSDIKSEINSDKTGLKNDITVDVTISGDAMGLEQGQKHDQEFTLVSVDAKGTISDSAKFSINLPVHPNLGLNVVSDPKYAIDGNVIKKGLTFTVDRAVVPTAGKSWPDDFGVFDYAGHFVGTSDVKLTDDTNAAKAGDTVSLTVKVNVDIPMWIEAETILFFGTAKKGSTPSMQKGIAQIIVQKQE